ncbi:MAG: CDP-diacylglycerol--glycerol-3-phosphate 3-phosphatidyltransferase [Gammaproteobacteria bacterium]
MLEYNLPTILTLMRIASIPLLVVVYYLPWQYSNFLCTVIFVAAAITDWLDGHLARKMDMETTFGAFLDPVADKLMVAIILVLIVQTEANTLLTVPAAIIIGREITIASLREWMAEIGERKQVAVSNLGKWKTGFQMTALGCLLFRDDLFFLPVKAIGYLCLYVAAILTLWSMMNYLKIAMQTVAIKR